MLQNSVFPDPLLLYDRLLRFNSNSRSSLNTLCPLISGLLLKLNTSHIKPFLFSLFIKNPTFLQGSAQMPLLPGSPSGFPQPGVLPFPMLPEFPVFLSAHSAHTASCHISLSVCLTAHTSALWAKIFSFQKSNLLMVDIC